VSLFVEEISQKIHSFYSRAITQGIRKARERRILSYKSCIPNELILAIAIEISKEQIDKIAQNTLNNYIY